MSTKYNVGDVVLVSGDIIGMVFSQTSIAVNIIPLSRLHERVIVPLANVQTLAEYDAAVVEAARKSAEAEAAKKLQAEQDAGLVTKPPVAADSGLADLVKQQQAQIAQLLAKLGSAT